MAKASVLLLLFTVCILATAFKPEDFRYADIGKESYFSPDRVKGTATIVHFAEDIDHSRKQRSSSLFLVC